MVGAEAGAGAAEIERVETMVPVEEAAVVAVTEVAALKEAEEAIATLTMKEKVVAVSMEADAVRDIIDTTTTAHTQGINSTHNHTSNNHRCRCCSGKPL